LTHFHHHETYIISHPQKLLQNHSGHNRIGTTNIMKKTRKINATKESLTL